MRWRGFVIKIKPRADQSGYINGLFYKLTIHNVVLSGAKNLYEYLRDPSLRLHRPDVLSGGNHDWVRKVSDKFVFIRIKQETG